MDEVVELAVEDALDVPDLVVGNIQAVLDGELDDFIHAYLLARAANKVG